MANATTPFGVPLCLAVLRKLSFEEFSVSDLRVWGLLLPPEGLPYSPNILSCPAPFETHVWLYDIPVEGVVEPAILVLELACALALDTDHTYAGFVFVDPNVDSSSSAEVTL